MDQSITSTTVATASADLVQRLRAKLGEYNLHVIIDKTRSMLEPVGQIGGKMITKSRWDYMQETLFSFLKFACEIDSDGIGLGFFSGNDYKSGQEAPYFDNVNYDKAQEIFAKFRPDGGTLLAPCLNYVFNNKIGQSGKKDLLVVFLDGEFQDFNDVKSQIIAQSNRQLKDNDCTVLFVQVGGEPDAKQALETLDDGLVGQCKFDIVDAKTVEEVAKYSSFEELLANAIVD